MHEGRRTSGWTGDASATVREMRRRLRSDRKLRATLIQCAVLVTALSIAGWALANLHANLERIGKDFSFGFLLAPASYDISFSPFLDYTSRDTHLKAGVVGLLNTVLVAVTGIVTATTLGFAMGIARLSSNWLVNRSVYVVLDFVRNVPLLLHILWIHGVIVSVLPAPRQAIEIAEIAFVSNRGLFLPAPSLGPGAWTFLGVLGLGIGAAVALRWRARQRQAATGQRMKTGRWTLGLLIGSGAAATAAAGLPITWEVPHLAGFNFTGGIGVKPEFLALWAALSGYTACFIAEAVRGAVEAIGKGQLEAGLALGMRRLPCLRMIIIPQAARIMVPPIVNQYLNLTKDSSLAIAIGYMDVVATIGGISLMQTGREVETMLIVLGVYLGLSVAISLAMGPFHRTTRLRAGREIQARARRARSVALAYDEAVSIREVPVRRMRIEALLRLWEAAEKACDDRATTTARIRWRSPDGWHTREVRSRAELERLDLSRAILAYLDGLEVLGKWNRIRIAESPPTTLGAVASARANRLEIDVRGTEAESCAEITQGLARLCQRDAGTRAPWRIAADRARVLVPGTDRRHCLDHRRGVEGDIRVRSARGERVGHHARHRRVHQRGMRGPRRRGGGNGHDDRGADPERNPVHAPRAKTRLGVDRARAHQAGSPVVRPRWESSRTKTRAVVRTA